MDLIEIHDELRAFVTEQAAKYPDFKLTFGYIGNYWTDGREARGFDPDDRSWYVFTKLGILAGPPGAQYNASPKFGGYETRDLARMLGDVRGPKWDAFIARCQGALAGETPAR